jgi:hypothetical protein
MPLGSLILGRRGEGSIGDAPTVMSLTLDQRDWSLISPTEREPSRQIGPSTVFLPTRSRGSPNEECHASGHYQHCGEYRPPHQLE